MSADGDRDYLLGTHDPEQARLAWSRTVEFLRANLG